jgi:hypothetical protein
MKYISDYNFIMAPNMLILLINSDIIKQLLFPFLYGL